MSLGPLMMDLKGLQIAPEEREMLRHPLIGSVILFARNFVDSPQLAQLVAEIHAIRSPALVVAVDQEGGRVQRFRTGFTQLPPLRRIGQQYDIDARSGLEWARQLGWLMAAELRAHGVDLSLAPCVDLDYGASEIIGDRAFHSHSDVVGQLAVSYMHGMKDAGMAATAKHFPGHGAVVADSHLALPVDRRPIEDMTDDLAPYRRLIANGLPAVMVAHVLFPEVDSVPASMSNRWIRGVLRGDLRFQGAVFSDDLSMAGAAAAGDIVTRAERALAAGCDVLPVCNNPAGVVTLLNQLKIEPEPASQLRIVRMRGREALSREALMASQAWRSSQEALARSAAAPALNLESGNA
jgi:beta-N-acetylhexosaminidase